MKFKDKYSMTDNKKVILKPEAFAVGELLQALIYEIQKSRGQ